MIGCDITFYHPVKLTATCNEQFTRTLPFFICIDDPFYVILRMNENTGSKNFSIYFFLIG